MLSFMKFGDKKRGEEAPSTLAKLSKTLAGVFKTKKDVDIPAAVGPCINPEELTAQKREWMDSQAAQVELSLATWPEHLFEHFFVVGLPPDVEVTQIAEDLCAKERRPRQEDAEQGTAGGTGGAAGSEANPPGHGGRSGGQSQPYDRAPRPSYDAKVLFRHPAAKPAPLSDQELVDLCFPHKVAPVKLRRSASMSSLHELVYGRQAASRDEQCFIFLLKVGVSLPLYGICCAVPEVLHRPPHLARHLYPACRMPYRSVMISAPRVYCLLSHYPFFDLHFQVLHVILGMERLHRTIDFNAEMEAAAAAAAAQPPPTGSGAAACLAAVLSSSAAGAPNTATTPSGSTGGGVGGTTGGLGGTGTTAGAGTYSDTENNNNNSNSTHLRHGDAKSHQLPPHQHQQKQQGAKQQEQQEKEQQQQQGSVFNGVRLSSRCYCSDCADVMVEMYPGLLQRPQGPPLLRATQSFSPQHQEAALGGGDGVGGLGGDGATEVPSTQIGTGPSTHGSVHRQRSAPGIPPVRDLARTTTAGAAAGGVGGNNAAGQLGGGGVKVAGCGAQQPHPGLAGCGGGDGNTAAAAFVGAADRCQACGRMLGGYPSGEGLGQGPPWPPQAAPAAVPAASARDQGLLEEVSEALETALDKLAALPKVVVAGVNEAAAAAVGKLRREGTSGGAASSGGGGAVAAIPATDSRTPLPGPHTDLGCRSPAAAGSSRAAISPRSGGGKGLALAPAEAVSALATKVRDTLLSRVSGGEAAGARRRGRTVGDGGSDGGGGVAPDGSVQCAGTAAAADVGVPCRSPPVKGRLTAQAAGPPPARDVTITGGGGLVTPPPTLPASSAAQRTASRQALVAVAAPGGCKRGGGPSAAGGLPEGAVGGGDVTASGGGVVVPEDAGQSVSLVQQLLRSVMAPVSPQPVSPGHQTNSPRGSPAASSIAAAIRSPSLPSSPREDCRGPAVINPPLPPLQPSHTPHPHAPAGPSPAPTPPGHSSWSLLNRLSRGGAGAPRCGSPSDHLGLSREYDSASNGVGGAHSGVGGSIGVGVVGGGGAVSCGGAAGGDGCSGSSIRGVVGQRGRGLESAFATAVEQATVVGQVFASPGQRYGTPTSPGGGGGSWGRMGGVAAMTPTVAAKPAASGLYGQNPPAAAAIEAEGGMDGTDSHMAVVTGSPGRTVSAAAAATTTATPAEARGVLHLLSISPNDSHGVAVDDIVLAPVRTILTTSRNTDPDRDGVLYGAVPPLPLAPSDGPTSVRHPSCGSQPPPPRPSPRSFLGASVPHLIEESSGFSVQASDASFYTADGADSELLQEGSDSTTTAAVTPAGSHHRLPSSAGPQPWLSPAGSSSSTPRAGNPVGDNPVTPGGSRRVDPQLSVQVPSQPYGGGCVVMLGGRPRAVAGATTTAAASLLPTIPAAAAASMATAAAPVRQSDLAGMLSQGGSVGALSTAGLCGLSRLGRAGAVPPGAMCSVSEGGDASQQQPQPQQLAAASSPPPLAAGTVAVPLKAALPAATPPPPLHQQTGGGGACGSNGGGGNGGGGSDCGGDGGGGNGDGGGGNGGGSTEGLVSPSPAGAAFSADMAHNFSPRHALDQLYTHPIVNPGEQLTLRFGGVTTLHFTRLLLGRRFTVVGPPRAIAGYAEAELAEELQHWTTAVLCRCLSLDNLLLLLSAALLERQLVVFCPAIALLTGCVLGLLPLLRPFSWHSLMLPVTPASMAGFLEAPVPFVLGVQYKTSEVKARCTHLVRVNVYKDKVKNAGAPLPPLPGLKRLTAALAPHHALLRRRLAHSGGVGGGTGSGSGPAGRMGAAAGSGGGPSGFGSRAVGGNFSSWSVGAVVGPNDGEAAADAGRSLRSLSPAEHAATSAILATLATHLGSMCGDLRPHVITNVGLHKRTGVLMKESLLEVVPRRDQSFVRQFVDTQMFSVWSDAIISADCEGVFTVA